MDALEMLANNIANQTTAGYKADREFYRLFRTPDAGVDGPPPPSLPVMESHWTDFSQGSLTPTGNPLDLAISGDGFFTVRGPGGLLYSRNGQFHVPSDGVLATTEGYPVLDRSGSPVQVDPTRPVEVSPDGAVHQDGAAVGEIGVVQFADPSALSKVAGTYFRSEQPGLSPTAAGDAEIQQGRLEGANASPAEAAVRLVGVMRQFEMLQRAVQLGSEMSRRAVEEVARVTG